MLDFSRIFVLLYGHAKSTIKKNGLLCYIRISTAYSTKWTGKKQEASWKVLAL